MSEYINNSAERKETLKKLILDLHDGGDLQEIKARFRELIGDISAVEIAQLEQSLIAEGLPVKEVQALCDVHVAVFQEALEGQASPEMTPGHPVHTFKAENFAAGQLLGLLDEAVAALPDGDALRRARAFAEQLGEIDKIYLRKENLLFPILERHGVTGPSSVMWATHDQIRDQMKTLRRALTKDDAEQVQEIFPPLAEAIRQMFYKEEHILYPTALRLLTDADWVAIRDQSGEIGYCLVRPGDQWHPEVEAAELPSAQGDYVTPTGQIPLNTGALTPEQINLVLTTLPVDVTFIDEKDEVRYFSQTLERIFIRTEAVIGRRVQNCHPPHSVHVVNRMLDEFRSGTRDSAEFWIQMGGKFIYIRYYPVRDGEGNYRGTLEVTQDITHIRKLEGERRLLDEA
jgi:PAS domain S-box-containing protein